MPLHDDESGAPRPLSTLLDGLRNETLSATGLLDEALARITAVDDGSIHTTVFGTTARAEAGAADQLRRAGLPMAPLAGLPIALKALFDVTDRTTHAGSRLLADAPPAGADAEIVARLRRAGAVLTGHTGMTEFAYSGLGLNPHYGTPANPWDPQRIPGGSSSGAAVAVARGMAAAAIGTDTGGSIRIPAAYCGLVGFKPSRQRIPMQGVFPLSPSLDAVGPLAHSVACCARLDAILSGQSPRPLAPMEAANLRLAIPRQVVLDDMDADVARAFERAVETLSRAGARIREIPAEWLLELQNLLTGGGFTAAESYYLHREWLEQHGERYDPRVRVRIERGADISAADYLHLQRERRRQIAAAEHRLEDIDALVMPTTPMVPPRFRELEDDAEYSRINLLVLRNPTVGNLLDFCGISLPCQRAEELPVGLMLLAPNGADRHLLRQAATVESVLGPVTRGC